MTARAPIGTQRRWLILQRDDFTCQFCGARPGNDRLHVDHLIPHSKGGGDHDNNLATACERCNAGKSDRIAIPSSWCAGPLLDDGFRVWKRWHRWSLMWTADAAILAIDESNYEWIDIIDRIYESHLRAHLQFKFDRDHWDDRDGVAALAGLAEAWRFAETLIRRAE